MYIVCRIRLTLLASVLVPCAFYQASGSQDAVAAALHDKEYSRALELLSPELRRSPGDPRLWAMQGTAWEGDGDNRQALASFRQALKLAPDYLPALQGAAQIDYDAGDAAGIPLLQRILRLRPADVTGHGMLAVLEYQEGNCAEASSQFEAAASLFASRPPALHAWTSCLIKLKRFDKAEEVMRQSLAANPDDRRERQVLASIQLMAETPQAALETLNPLLAPDPDTQSLDIASAAYEQAHQKDKAIDALRQAILLDPENVTLYVDFAAISARYGFLKTGIGVIDDGLSLQPKAAPLYFARGMLCAQLEEYDEAQSDFETAYNLDPTQSLTAAAQGLEAIQQNDLTRALAGVQEKLAHHPDDPVLLYLQADVLTRQGLVPGSPEFQTAMRSALRAVGLRPTLAPARSVLAKLYLEAGQYQQAALQSRKALELDPRDQTALYHLIMALRKTDQKEEIPNLLKRLALLRAQETQNERDQYRSTLVEDGAQPR
jgi:tetratricopeptide (TPR) repeat protein